MDPGTVAVETLGHFRSFGPVLGFALTLVTVLMVGAVFVAWRLSIALIALSSAIAKIEGGMGQVGVSVKNQLSELRKESGEGVQAVCVELTAIRESVESLHEAVNGVPFHAVQVFSAAFPDEQANKRFSQGGRGDIPTDEDMLALKRKLEANG